jgi:GNAT superfamily N-acetyltransferase
MIRQCGEADFETILLIINDAAEAYRGIIPEDRWHDPYMSREELRTEIDDGVIFWGVEQKETLIGVMGIQDRGDVTLIRHSYVKTEFRNRGVGKHLLQFLERKTGKPILIGTWVDASWAIRFYEKNGYRLLSEEEKNRMLRKYWTIPERQVETSVVLSNQKSNG